MRHNFRDGIGDPGKDRCLNPWVGKKARYSTRANATRGLGNGSAYPVRAPSVYPGRVDIRRSGDGGRVTQQRRRSSDGEAFARPCRDGRWGFGPRKHSNSSNGGAPSAEHFGARWCLGVRMEVGVHCCTRHMMRSVFTPYRKDRLLIASRCTYQRADNLGRHLVVNCDGVRAVLLPDELERGGRTAYMDVVPPKRCKSVSVVVSGIPVIADAQQPPL